MEKVQVAIEDKQRIMGKDLYRGTEIQRKQQVTMDKILQRMKELGEMMESQSEVSKSTEEVVKNLAQETADQTAQLCNSQVRASAHAQMSQFREVREMVGRLLDNQGIRRQTGRTDAPRRNEQCPRPWGRVDDSCDSCDDRPQNYRR